MSTQLQFRRGNTFQHSTFTGVVGEVTVDTDNNILVVHDGITPGGFPAPTLQFANAAFEAVNATMSYIQVPYGRANNAFFRANAAFERANSGYDHANSAYDNANSKVSLSGDTMTGNLEVPNLSVTGNLTVTNVLVTNDIETSNIIIDNVLYSGLATRLATPLPNLIAQFTGNTDSYVQVNAQNIDPHGSGDYVVTADVGTDTTFFIDMGIQGSLLSQGALHPLDGYLIVQGNTGQLGGNLVVGTSIAGTETHIVAGGLEDANVVVVFTDDMTSTFSGNVNPTVDNTQYLGLPDKRWHSLFVGPGSVDIDNLVLSNNNGVLTVTGATDIQIAGSVIPPSANISGHANSAYDQANTGTLIAQAAFDSANNVAPQIQPSFDHANAAFNKANSAYTAAGDASTFAGTVQTYAQAGFAKANAANVLAQASFTVANTKFSSSGGTITGDVTIQGQANVENRLAVGTGSYTVLPNLIAQFTGTSDFYSQISQQNLSGNGSADIVLTADNGTDLQNFFDMGLAGSTYDNTGYNAYSFSQPNDAWLILAGDAAASFGGNLTIGTSGSSAYSDIAFVQGNSFEESARLVSGQGLVVYKNVQANNFTINQYADFAGTASNPSNVEGRLWYNTIDHALRAGTEHSGVFIDLGKQLVTRVKNNSGVTIPKGAAVYVTGGEAVDVPYVAMAQSNSYSTIDSLIGAARESIADGSYGYVVTSGPITGIDTSGVATGHIVYVSNTTPGGYIDADIGPADGFAVHLGMCLYSDSVNGAIQVALKGIEWGANFTNGSVAFSNGFRLFEDPTQFYYDYDNHRLGLGTDTPTHTLHVAGDTMMAGNVTITGNLVAANITSVSTSQLTVSGNTILLSDGTSGSPVYNASIIVVRGSSPNAHIRWDETTDEWVLFDGAEEGHIIDSTKTFTDWTTYSGAATYEKNSYPIGADLSYATYQLATNANTIAYAGQSTAVSATSLAQAAFNKANTGGVQSVTSNSSSRITQNATQGAVTLDLATSGVTAGSYTYPSIQVDAYGRTIAISNQTPVTSFNGMTGSVSLSSANVVSALGYTPANKAGDNFTGAVISTSLTSNTSVSINGVGVVSSNTFTTSSTGQVAVDAFTLSSFRSAKYVVQMTSGSSYHFIELGVLSDGVVALATQYGEMLTGSSLGTFDVSVSGGIVSLLFTAANAITTVKLVRTSIAV